MGPQRNRRLRAGVAVAATAVVGVGGAAPALAAPGDGSAGAERIAALVAQLTVPEEFGMLGGTNEIMKEIIGRSMGL